MTQVYGLNQSSSVQNDIHLAGFALGCGYLVFDK